MNEIINILKEKILLVTCSGWFTAPDGKMYCTAWGKVKIFNDQDTLGIKTNNQSANWYAFIGSDDKGIIIAGCQIKYAVICDKIPDTQNIQERRVSDEKAESFRHYRETIIYIAQ